MSIFALYGCGGSSSSPQSNNPADKDSNQGNVSSEMNFAPNSLENMTFIMSLDDIPAISLDDNWPEISDNIVHSFGDIDTFLFTKRLIFRLAIQGKF